MRADEKSLKDLYGILTRSCELQQQSFQLQQQMLRTLLRVESSLNATKEQQTRNTQAASHLLNVPVYTTTQEKITRKATEDSRTRTTSLPKDRHYTSSSEEEEVEKQVNSSSKKQSSKEKRVILSSKRHPKVVISNHHIASPSESPQATNPHRSADNIETVTSSSSSLSSTISTTPPITARTPSSQKFTAISSISSNQKTENHLIAQSSRYNTTSSVKNSIIPLIPPGTRFDIRSSRQMCRLLSSIAYLMTETMGREISSTDTIVYSRYLDLKELTKFIYSFSIKKLAASKNISIQNALLIPWSEMPHHVRDSNMTKLERKSLELYQLDIARCEDHWVARNFCQTMTTNGLRSVTNIPEYVAAYEKMFSTKPTASRQDFGGDDSVSGGEPSTSSSSSETTHRTNSTKIFNNFANDLVSDDSSSEHSDTKSPVSSSPKPTVATLPRRVPTVTPRWIDQESDDSDSEEVKEEPYITTLPNRKRTCIDSSCESSSKKKGKFREDSDVCEG